MKFRVSYLKSFVLVAVLSAGLISCDIGSSNSGRLSLSLTDKPNHDFTAVYITIESIAVHAADDPEGSWNTILNVHRTFNLMELANGVREQLGIVSLEPGHYTQMRLIIGEEPISPNEYANWIIDAKNELQPLELKIPSGPQTGVKFVQGFDINENSTTELVFDFDATRSVVVAGNSGKYLLKPTIHMIDDSQVRTVIKGTVMATVESEDVGLEGANVSLQIYSPPEEGQDPKDEVTVFTSTVTDPEGAYMFFFLDVPDETTFNVVATNWASEDPDYAPKWDQIPDAVNGNVYEIDFNLPVAEEIGTLSLKAIVPDAEPDTPVTISVRQLSDLADGAWVEVRSVPIVGYDLDDFNDIVAVDVKLPFGIYEVVASTDDWVSVVQENVTIDATDPIPCEFEFTTQDTI